MEQRSLNGRIAQTLGFPEIEPGQIPPLNLAYIGDTIYDLYVRSKLVATKNETVHQLHLLSAKLVCAQGQAAAFFRIEGMLTEEEKGEYRRGRNAHSGTVPKNATVGDYRVATGLEALLGYLYFQGADERIDQLLQEALKQE